jgi:hypothetical protein
MSELPMTNHNEVILRGAINTIASQVKPCTPWTFVSKVPAELLADKDKFDAWRKRPASEHLVYTGYEAVNCGMRVSKNKNNPVRRMHAIVVDYDAINNDEACATVLDRCPADLRPTWFSRTFSPGHARLVYMFEAPLCVEVGPLLKEFLKIAYNELQVKKLLAGPEDGAFMDPARHYDVGRDWKKLGDFKLSTNMLNYWLVQAAKKTHWDEIGEIVIPIEKVAAEVERQFPGRWQGAFEVGARGVVFFNPNSTNPTAAIVTEAGMICFSEDQLFHPWSKIFGGSFIRQFQQDKIGAAVKNVWYDGRYYYLKSTYGVWEPHSKEDFIARLKVRHGIDAGKGRGEVSSEMDQTLVYVQENRRVSGVVPRVYDKSELLYFNGRRFLNCAAVDPIIPADTPQEWGVNFPWIAEFLDTAFDRALVPCVTKGKPPQPADVILHAWTKRFYGSALGGELDKGQALFLAGGVDRGKTLLSTRIIGGLLGGLSDASDFLNSSTSFNKELLEVGLWCIDDGVASQDPQAHQKFSDMVKRAVANPFFSYHAKYRDAQRVAWHGRVVTTLNDDASSIRILPNLDTSIEDKIIVLKFAEGRREFPDAKEMNNILARELPFYARWLIDHQPPPELYGDKRFGVNSYIDESLRVKSLHAGGVSDLMELIDLWIKRCRPMEKHGKEWKGNASEWFAEASLDEGLRPLVSKFTVRSLGKKFVEASRIPGSRISVVPHHEGNLYAINLDAGAPPAVYAGPQASFPEKVLGEGLGPRKPASCSNVASNCATN